MTPVEILKKSENVFNKYLENHQKLAELVSRLPKVEGLNYLDISTNSAYADGKITIEIPTRDGLESLIEQFSPVDLVSVSNQWFAIVPSTNDHAKSGKVTPVAPMYFQLRQWVPGEIHKDFIWYTQMYGKLLEVVARVKDDPAHYEEYHHRKGNIIFKYEWRAVSLPGTISMNYSNDHAPKTPPIYLSYWEKDCQIETILNNL